MGIALAWAGIKAALPADAASPKPSATDTSKPKYIFYPPAPAPPRLQFLVSVSGEADFGPTQSKFAKFLVGKEPAQRRIIKPYGMAFWDGKLLVCDTQRHGLDVLDFGKNRFSYYGDMDDKPLLTPINITIDRDGTRYIADRGYNQVLVYGTNDRLQATIGDPPSTVQPDLERPAFAESGPGGFTNKFWPTDVAVSSNRLYVADLNNNCVRVFDKASREYRFKVPRDPQDEASRLFGPVNLALDKAGNLYVSDLGGFCVKKYDADGAYLQTFGRLGDRPGQFARPKGMALDREGRLYVVDAVHEVVVVFDAQGRVLTFFGEPRGSPAPLSLPAKVIIDYDHVGLFQKYAAPGFKLEYLVIVSNQLGNRKVSVYGYGQKL